MGVNSILLSQIIKSIIGLIVGISAMRIFFKNSILMKVGGVVVVLVMVLTNQTRISAMGYYGEFWSLMIILVLTVFSLYLINKFIKEPLSSSINKIEKLSQGNLNIEIEQIESSNELSVLNNSISVLLSNFQKVVTEIQQNAEHLSNASEQINQTAQSLSSISSEQASSTEEIASTIEEAVANVENNTENSRRTSKKSAKVHEEVLRVNKKAEGAVSSNNLINDKVAVIKEIADRDAAEEIVNLSVTTKNLSDEAGKSLSLVLPEIKETAKLVENITTSSIEQSAGIDQINGAILQLNQIAQQSAVTSEELATTSKEMTAQAERLKKVIEYFKLE